MAKFSLYIEPFYSDGEIAMIEDFSIKLQMFWLCFDFQTREYHYKGAKQYGHHPWDSATHGLTQWPIICDWSLRREHSGIGNTNRLRRADHMHAFQAVALVCAREPVLHNV